MDFSFEDPYGGHIGSVLRVTLPSLSSSMGFSVASASKQRRRVRSQRPRARSTGWENLETRRLYSTYYVSPNGSDTNTGLSAQSAWQSINQVNSASFSEGDSILFQGGATFNGTLWFDPGQPGAAQLAGGISIGSYGSGRATINAGDGAGIYAHDYGGFNISNLNFTGSGASTNTSSGIDFYNDLSGNTKLSHVYIDNVDASGFGDTGVILGGYNGASGYDDVRITNTSAHDNRQAGIGLYGYTFDANSKNYANTNVYVGHCTVYNNYGNASATHNTGNGIVLGSVNGATVERNVSHDNGINNPTSDGPVGIWAYDSNGVTVQSNESYHNRTGSAADGGGFDFDQNTTNSLMQYNYSHDNDGVGYLVFAAAGVPASGNVLRYNISQNDGRKNNLRRNLDLRERERHGRLQQHGVHVAGHQWNARGIGRDRHQQHPRSRQHHPHKRRRIAGKHVGRADRADISGQ